MTYLEAAQYIRLGAEGPPQGSYVPPVATERTRRVRAQSTRGCIPDMPVRGTLPP
eukprot:COSAG01_NODE_1569_length_9870_cov_27.746699_9_plen_55_part_00